MPLSVNFLNGINNIIFKGMGIIKGINGIGTMMINGTYKMITIQIPKIYNKIKNMINKINDNTYIIRRDKDSNEYSIIVSV
jgi:hypothetical protein